MRPRSARVSLSEVVGAELLALLLETQIRPADPAPIGGGGHPLRLLWEEFWEPSLSRGFFLRALFLRIESVNLSLHIVKGAFPKGRGSSFFFFL